MWVHFWAMFNEEDDIYFDFDVVSSPLTSCDCFPSTSLTVELPNNSFFNDNCHNPSYDSCCRKDLSSFNNSNNELFQRVDSMPEISLPNNDYPSFSVFQAKMSSPVKPKVCRKQSVVFQPFASFDATELTVKALQKTTFSLQKQTILNW